MPSLCSDHEKKNTKTKEVYGKTKDVFECFSLLECCSCFISALDQNKVRAFFFLKDSFKFPTHCFLLLADGVTAELELALRVLYRLL